MTVRVCSRDDDLDAVHREDPSWLGSASFWNFHEALQSDHPAYTWCFDDGRPVAHAALDCEPTRGPEQARALLWVAPEARRCGIGTRLRSTIQLMARENGFRTALVSVPEADLDGRDVAEHWGARLDGHHVEQSLDLSAFDDERVRRHTGRAVAAGVTFHEVVGEESLRAVYPFARDRFAETPDAGDDSAEVTFEVFRSVATPGHVLVARLGDRLVGLTCVRDRDEDPPAATTMFTGVHPDVRGRGVATALKAEQARRLRDQGYRTVVTHNMDGNEPILAANRRLGFVPRAGWFDYVLPTGP